MAAYMNDIMLDGSLDYLIANGKEVHLLSTYSTVYATIKAAGGSMGSFIPTITKLNDGTIGRKADIAAATGIAITTVVPTVDETFINYAVLDTVNLTVLYVGDGTSKILSNGDTVSTPIFSVKIADAITV